jgi:5-methylcytosine-specific restriction endonuclease McrA
MTICPKCGSTNLLPRTKRCRKGARTYVYHNMECVPCTLARHRRNGQNRQWKDRKNLRRRVARHEEKAALAIRKRVFDSIMKQFRAYTAKPQSPWNARAIAERAPGETKAAAYWRIRYAEDLDWRAKQIERTHAKNLRRKMGRLLMSDGTLHGRAIQSLFATAKRCPYCQKQIDPKDKTLDHIIPVSRGGAHSILNVVVCCRRCNTAKGARTPLEWAA